jgi:sulfonate transport system ATP-binding protein
MMSGGDMCSESLLEIRAVGKTYIVDDEPIEVLRNIHFTVEAGEFVTIIGASGCGKSTLLRLIVGLDTEYRGDILLDGRRIEGPAADRGMVFQEHRLFPWLSVAENIALGLDASGDAPASVRQTVTEHVKLVKLSGFERAYPHQLSGGMAQRAAIARALVGRPEILLLDEPLGALDSQTRAYMQDELLRIHRREKVTMVMVTHDIEEAVYLSDKIVVMEPRPGRVRGIVPVEMSHPRDRLAVDFVALKARVLSHLVNGPPLSLAAEAKSRRGVQDVSATRYG